MRSDLEQRARPCSQVPPSAGLRDTRVEWWGPVKFAWRLRAHQKADEQVLLLWGVGGHFVDDPNHIAMEKTFLLLALGAEHTDAGVAVGG
jgi:protease II